MVIYFSGTGNSEFVAKTLAENLNEECVTFNELIKQNKYKLEFKKAENLILVFPIYAWQPPKFILEYLAKVDITGEPTISAIATCGGEVGQAMKVLRKTLGKKNLRLRNFVSVTMPDNYIVMFDVENESEINQKVENCKDFIKTITEYLKQGNSFQTVKKGSFPLTKTYILSPLFQLMYMSSKPFFTDDNCINCGKCVEFCPMDNIKIVDNEVVFGKDCVQCMSCINRCPFKAIQYGKKTKDRGRYVFKE